MMKVKISTVTLSFFFLFLLVTLLNFDILVKSQEEVTKKAKPITANVTVQGSVGKINITCFPVNFTSSDTSCLAPGTANRSKLSPSDGECGTGKYLRISLIDNNVPWELYLNASDIVSLSGNFRITPDNIHVNSTCGGGTPVSSWIALDYGLKHICSGVPWNGVVDVEFYVDVPAGYENNTYLGNLSLFINSTSADNNRSMILIDNTTLTICKFIEIAWNPNTKPIMFPPIPAGVSDKAITNQGFPSNITNTPKTNIFIDYYINGSDFVNTTVPVPVECQGFLVGSQCKFESGNITYSNATSNTTWPDGLRPLSNNFATPPPYGDFPNWAMVRNNSETPSWWNISIPAGLPRATYESNIVVEGVDHGTLP